MFVHLNINVVPPVSADFDLLSGQGIYNLIAILFSNALGSIAVPIFFFISGFLFFRNIDNWSWGVYKKKLKSRAYSLLIPYILWNALPFLTFVLCMLIKGEALAEVQNQLMEGSWHIFYDYHHSREIRNWLGQSFLLAWPYNIPLWFLRELMVMSLLSPFIFYTIRKTGLFIIGILFFAYISNIWITIPGFNIKAVFYFSLGAYFALNKINLILFAQRYKMIFIPLFLLLLIIAVLYNGDNTDVGNMVQPFFLFFSVFAAFYLVSKCVSKHNIKPNKFLISNCFVIYVAHGTSILGIGSLYGTSRLLHLLIPENTAIEKIFHYFATPFVTACICIVILMLSKKILPKLTMVFMGNRLTKRTTN